MVARRAFERGGVLMAEPAQESPLAQVYRDQRAATTKSGTQ